MYTFIVNIFPARARRSRFRDSSPRSISLCRGANVTGCGTAIVTDQRIRYLEREIESARARSLQMENTANVIIHFNFPKYRLISPGRDRGRKMTANDVRMFARASLFSSLATSLSLPPGGHVCMRGDEDTKHLEHTTVNPHFSRGGE